MIISFAITVYNELEEIKRLVPFLLENKRIEDEIVILYDEKNGDPEVLNFLLSFNLKPNIQTWRGHFENNFAEWKNKLNSYCKGDFIVSIDADEMISEYMIKNLHQIIEMNPNVDLIYVPRINIVDNITKEDIDNWGWVVNEQGWINHPDFQGRIHRRDKLWINKVHERIGNAENVATLPFDEEYSIFHHKDIHRQRKQNLFYETIQK
jgi:hypothetical protein